MMLSNGNDKAARKNLKLSRAVHFTGPYYFYWSNSKPCIRITSVTTSIPSFLVPLFQNESSSKTLHMKI